jgi:hypothetical protein
MDITGIFRRVLELNLEERELWDDLEQDFSAGTGSHQEGGKELARN